MTVKDCFAGLDLGSTSVKLALVSASGEVIHTHYERHHGRVVESAVRLLERFFGSGPGTVSTEGATVIMLGSDRWHVRGMATTGVGAGGLSSALGCLHINEVVALSGAMRRLFGEYRTVIEVGGQDAKIIELGAEPSAAGAGFKTFAMNSECAAGTGSFLDQQATRLGVNIEGEFGQLALKSQKPPRVAGRCSVFAKSDMIHLQQQAVADHDIVAGLCFGMARNFKATLARGRELAAPVAFVGGVASNAGMVRAFREVLGLDEDGFRVPEHHAVLPAIGAALQALEGQGKQQQQHPPAVPGALEQQQQQQQQQRLAANGHGTRAGSGYRGLDLPDHGTEEDHVGGFAIDIAALRELAGRHADQVAHLERLVEPTGYIESRLAEVEPAAGLVNAYLGVDVGSISTNLVLLDEGGQVLDKRYLMTAGRPIEAVRSGLGDMAGRWSGRVNVLGAATTGSGRYLTGDIIGADAVRNEITCQARGAVHVDPQVDTIFEIGGQDSKYIRLRDGVVVDFEMNHVCAAGTGSFLEEQAERLGISIKDEFARLALSSEAPIRLGERCTVFMESDLQHHQQQGAGAADLVAGLSYSIVANYLNRVVGTRSIGERILFQGGTAFNRAVTAAFEKLTGRPIVVPPHHEVTGAIGAALVARDAHLSGAFSKSAFRGFELAERPYKVRTFTCNACSNACDIREVSIGDDEPLFYGSRCDRYNKKQSSSVGVADGLPDLFAERERLLLGGELDHGAEETHPQTSLWVAPVRRAEAPGTAGGYQKKFDHGAEKGNGSGRRGVVGVPRAISFHQLLPFFRTLLEELDFEVLLSPATDAEIVHSGVESVTSQTCFPIKVAHGHVRWLMEQGVDFVFVPSVLALPRDHQSQRYNHLCPYVQSLPYQIRTALNVEQAGVKLLSPVIDFEGGYESALDGLRSWAAELKIGRGELGEAVRRAVAAQQRFEQACVERGRELLDNPPAGAQLAVVVSRPYNGCDAGVNLDLPKRMREAGLLPIPMDMLDLRQIDLGEQWGDMFWKYGQKILHAARIIASRDDLRAVYLSNFGCGPDSFLRRFFQETMGRKPFLALEIDEHSAAAGLITRLEAFVDSSSNGHGDGGSGGDDGNGESRAVRRSGGSLAGRTLMVPKMCDHAYAFAAAFRGAGIDARIIPDSDDESLALGRRHTSGKECLPCIVTAGDMLRELGRPGADASRMAFFMPSGTGPCRFGMYNRLHQVILSEAGYPDVPVVSPNQGDSFYDDFKRLPRDPTRPAWQGIVAVDALTQALLRVRPYEVEPGSADETYRRCLHGIEAALEDGRSLREVMIWSARQFEAIERRDDQHRKARVILVGEIYVRNHAFSNQDIIRRLEGYGLEVEIASFAEWIYYTNWTRLRRTWGRRQYRRWLGTRVKDSVQRADERRLKAPFARLLSHAVEERTADVVSLGHPYINDTFEGEAVLSVGKAVEAVRRGASGIVNVMPFTCMPGNIVAGILGRVSENLGGTPAISIAYDGQKDATLDIRLEAFAEQVKGVIPTR